VKRLLFLNAHGLDLLTFAWAVSIYGVSGEANPLMRGLYALGGMAGILVIRVVAVGLFAWHAPKWPTLLTFGTWLGMVGALSNAVAVGLR
jgi:hypothetical protein